MQQPLLGRIQGRTAARPTPWGRLLAVLAVLLMGSGAAWGQSVASYATARITTGVTYSSIASTGNSFSSWRNNTSTDDNLSGATPIGFTFYYDGTAYTQFSLSTNGYLTFNTGTSATGSGTGIYGRANSRFSNTTAATASSLAVLYYDLTTGTNAGTATDLAASFKYLTTGTAGSRVLTAEWIGLVAYGSTGSLNFQVRLYEADGHIEYQYGTMTAGNGAYAYTLGINGPGNGTAASQLLTQQTANSNTFSNVASNSLATIPAANSKYTFTPPLPAAPTSLTFSSVASTSMTVGFTDNSTTENNFLVQYSTDNATFTNAGTVTSTTKAGTGTAYSLSLTGLTAGTTYYFRVYAIAEVPSSALTGSQATAAGTPRTVNALTYTQNGANTYRGQTNQQVTGLNVNTAGTSGSALTLSSITFDLGSTSPADITNARLYSTGTSATFATTTLVATTGTIAGTYTLTLTTPAALPTGDNYFWLTYDLSATATPGNTVASVPTAVGVSGVSYTAATTPAITLSGPAASRPIVGPLNGTYTVGVGGQYATLTAALADLNLRGVDNTTAGAAGVTLSLINQAASTVYNAANGETFPLTVNVLPGADAAHRVTIKPAAGVTASISGASGSSQAVLVLNGADYVTIDGSNAAGGTTRDLTITNTSTTTSAVVWVKSLGTAAGATYDRVQNLNLAAGSNSATTYGIVAGASTFGSAGADNDYLTVQNNAITTCAKGILAAGVSAGLLDGLAITGNLVGPATAATATNLTNTGIQLQGIAAGGTLSGNTVRNVSTSTDQAVYGIYVITTTGLTVSGNTISGIGNTNTAGTYNVYGLYLGSSVTNTTATGNNVSGISTASTDTSYYPFSIGIVVVTGTANSNVTVSNNFVSNLNCPNGPTGVFVDGTTAQSGIKLYHNSVSLAGTYTATSAVSVALYVVSGATGLDFRNNILACTPTYGTGSTGYAFYSAAPKTAYTTIDYNDYYVSGSQNTLAYFNSGSRATLAALRDAANGTGQDANSLSVAPPFVSATNLHIDPTQPTAAQLDGKATPVGVTTDIDNDSRDASTPDVGADEFTLPSQDVGVVALTAPAANNCYAGAQPVTVTVQNYGSTPAAISIPVSVTVTNPNGTTQTLTGTYSGAAIAAGGTASFTVGNYTVNGSGTYYFDAKTTYTPDANPSNNALAQQAVQVTVPDAITVTASPTGTVCGNSPVTLTASSSTTYDYTWTATTGGNLQGASGATVTATPSQTATYTVTGTTPTGCIIQQTITITVNPAPSLTVTPTTSTVCAGTSQTLTATATTAPVTILPTATFDSGTDGFTVTTGSANTTGGEFTRVGAPYTASSGPGNYNGPSGSGTGSFYIADSNVSGRTSQTYLTSPAFSTVGYSAASLNFQQYYVDYYDNAARVEYSLNGTTWTTLVDYTGLSRGTSSGAQAVTTVALPAAALGQSSVQVRFYYYTTYAYYWALDNVGVTGTPAPTYQWTLVSGDGLPATTTTASISVTPTQNSVYRVTATNPQTSCTASATAAVTVNPRPTAALSASPGSVSPGGTATVSIALTGTAPWTFTYTANGANPVTVTGTSTNPYTFTTPALSGSVTYAVTALRDANCTATSADLAGSSTTVTVIAPPLDVAVVALASPASTAPGTCANPAQTVTVRIQNAGTQPLDFGQNPVTVTATVSGPNPQTFSTTLGAGTLAASATQDVTLTTAYDMSAAGTYTFALQASTAPQDSNPGNDTRTDTRDVTVPAAVAVTPASSTVCLGNSQTLAASVAATVLLPTATFDSGTDGFTVAIGTTGTANSSGYEFGRVAAPYTNSTGPNSSGYNGPSGSATGGFFIANSNTSGKTSNSQLVSPAFSTVGVPAATLSFQQYYRYSSGDVAKVEYSLDGTTWTQLASYSATQGTNSGAQTATAIALPAAALGQPSVRVRFNYVSTYGWYWALDNVGVSYTPATTYQWTLVSGDGLPATTTTASISVTPTQNSVYRVTATNSGTGCSTTTTASVSVTSETVWTGAVSNAWLTSGNWTACVPSATTSARIPAGLATYPTVSAASVTKNLVVESGATVTHTAGTLQVWGDLTNSGTYAATGGTIAFRGTGAQQVTGLTSYNNLTLSQGTSASTVTLMNNATVSNNLTLTAGVLNTNGNTLTLGSTAALVSETDANYVLGRVTTTRSLTSGTAQSFGGLGLTLTPAAGSTSPGLTAVVRVTGTTLTGQGTSQSIQRYFDIQPTVNTGLNVQLDFSYLDHERNGIAAASMQLFKSTTGPAGPWERQLWTTVSGNTVTKTGITDFSTWTLGDGANPLPVQLARFEAERQGADALLTWTTASELNNRGFEVEVSADGQQYRPLGFVAGAGSSASAHSYRYLDQEAGKAGRRYYRLRQLDYSGAATYSPVRVLTFEVAGLLVQAVPNPFAGRLTLWLTLPAASPAPTELLLTDALGRPVLRQTLPALPAGTTQAEVTGADQLPTGVYLLRVSVAGGDSRTLKIVRE